MPIPKNIYNQQLAIISSLKFIGSLLVRINLPVSPPIAPSALSAICINTGLNGNSTSNLRQL